MHVEEVHCPECGAVLVVDGGLFEIGSVRLRCSACACYFLPVGSPGSRTVPEVTNANVEIAIWEPEETE